MREWSGRSVSVASGATLARSVFMLPAKQDQVPRPGAALSGGERVRLKRRKWLMRQRSAGRGYATHMTTHVPKRTSLERRLLVPLRPLFVDVAPMLVLHIGLLRDGCPRAEAIGFRKKTHAALEQQPRCGRDRRRFP